MTTQLAVVAMFLSVADAQEIVVQQPAVQQFAVSTSLNIPDRGSAFLGGVSNASSSINQYGPFPFGSQLGSSRSHSTTSAHVYIHDFELMDRILLMEGERRLKTIRPETVTDPRVRHVLKKSHHHLKYSPTPRSQQERQKALSVLKRFR